MTPVFAVRRRAEEFAALVDAPSTGGSDGARFDDLLTLVGTLRDTTPVTPRPEFVADLRGRLMTAADAALAPAEAAKLRPEAQRLTLPPRRSARDRRIAAAVGGLALVGATTSMAMAAQNALPGDVLYPVKRAVENAQTGIQLGDGDKGVALLAHASGRLDEVRALSEDPSGEDTAAIADTLAAFVDQASEASDLLLANYAENGDQASISELRDFNADSLDQLTALESEVPDAVQDELVRAAQLLVEIDAAAQRACPLCAGSGITEIPRIFAPTSAEFTVPDPSGAVARTPVERGDGTRAQQEARPGGTPAVPGVNPGQLPAGSVQQPAPAPAPAPTPTPDGGQQAEPSNDDPIGNLTDKLENGGSTDTSSPTKPDPGDVVDDVKDQVKDQVDDVKDQVKDQADDVKDKVDDVVDGVGDVVDPITGEVLP
jgi:uncharacterized protein YjbJ (UPF0337 family)